MPGRQNRQLEQRCSQLYAAWGIPQGDVNAGYLSCAVGIACSTSQKLAIRKEILQAVSEQFDTSVAAVESGIRRMVDQLEEKPPLAWLAFINIRGEALSLEQFAQLSNIIYDHRSAV